MPPVLDLQSSTTVEALASRAALALRSGVAVVLPTGSGPVLATLAHQVKPQWMPAGSKANPGALAIVPSDAETWIPAGYWVARRLARRLWPGCLQLQLPVDASSPAWQGLSGPARERLSIGECRRLCSPGHALLQEVLGRVGEPVVVCEAGGSLSAEGQAALAPDIEIGLVIEDSRIDVARSATVVHCSMRGWQIVTTGALSETEIEENAVRRILFVCTGNTCRSPLAEGILKKLLAKRLGCEVQELASRGFSVLSAGLNAIMGCAASAQALTVAREMDVDLAGHRSQPLREQLLREADDVLVVTLGHQRALQIYYPGVGPAPRLLATTGGDIPDPFGLDELEYRKCAAVISEHLVRRLDDFFLEEPGSGRRGVGQGHENRHR